MTSARHPSWLGFTILVASACGVTEPARGNLEVSVATIGLDPDDQTTVMVDDAPVAWFDLNETRILPGVSVGEHRVGLLGVNNNCTALPAGPQQVSVEPTTLARVAFRVACVATSGAIRVSVTTSGETPDEDGYVVYDMGQGEYWGSGTARHVGPVGTAVLSPVPAESREVWIDGVAPNCAPVEPVPQTAIVRGGGTTRDTASVSFTVVCHAK